MWRVCYWLIRMYHWLWEEGCTVADRLASIGARDALTLLRLSFSSPKIILLSRLLTAIWGLPLVKSQILLCLIFSGYRLLCQLHTAASGVRRVSSLAIHAFLASALSTLPLQDNILSSGIPSHRHIPWQVHVHVVLIGWSTTWSCAGKTVILGQTWSSY